MSHASSTLGRSSIVWNYRHFRSKFDLNRRENLTSESRCYSVFDDTTVLALAIWSLNIVWKEQKAAARRSVHCTAAEVTALSVSRCHIIRNTTAHAASLVVARDVMKSRVQWSVTSGRLLRSDKSHGVENRRQICVDHNRFIKMHAVTSNDVICVAPFARSTPSSMTQQQTTSPF